MDLVKSGKITELQGNESQPVKVPAVQFLQHGGILGDRWLSLYRPITDMEYNLLPLRLLLRHWWSHTIILRLYTIYSVILLPKVPLILSYFHSLPLCVSSLVYNSNTFAILNLHNLRRSFSVVYISVPWNLCRLKLKTQNVIILLAQQDSYSVQLFNIYN